MTRTPDRYLELIRQFPLRPLRGDADHRRATAVAQELMGRTCGGETDYLDALLILIRHYEDAHHELDESMTPAQALRALMAANGLTQADLAEILGSQSAASMILSGARQPSKTHIRKLCDRFRLTADVFLGRAA